MGKRLTGSSYVGNGPEVLVRIRDDHQSTRTGTISFLKEREREREREREKIDLFELRILVALPDSSSRLNRLNISRVTSTLVDNIHQIINAQIGTTQSTYRSKIRSR